MSLAARSATLKSATVGHDVEIDRGFLTALPQERFEVAEISPPVVDRKCCVRVRTNRYSVPAGLVGTTVIARLTPLSSSGRITCLCCRFESRARRSSSEMTATSSEGISSSGVE
ncbi:MAG: Mu transposase domain-containing protein [Actinomycetota bacterium]